MRALLSAHDVADELGVPLSTAYEYVRTMIHVRTGRHVRVTRQAFDAWLRRHTCGTSLACGWWGRVWSLQEIQAHLGHAQVSTTERYAKIATEEVRRAAAATTGGPGAEGHRKRSRLDHGPRSAARNRHKPAPSAGVGPATFGLGSPRDASEIAAQNAGCDPSGANALALLLAAARGEADEAVRLAEIVAPGRTIREALAVAEECARAAMSHEETA